MRAIYAALLVGVALLAPKMASAQDFDLFSGNFFGVSTTTPLGRQLLVNIEQNALAQYAREAQLGNIALLQEKQRLSPILNCQAPAASPLSFAITQCLTGR